MNVPAHLTSESPAFIRSNSSKVSKISLIANHHDADISFSMLSELIKPLVQIEKRLRFGQIIHNKGTHSTTIIPTDDINNYRF